MKTLRSGRGPTYYFRLWLLGAHPLFTLTPGTPLEASPDTAPRRAVTSSVRQGTDNSTESAHTKVRLTYDTTSVYGSPTLLAILEDQAISESSGIIASRLNTEIFWTHNDSGRGPFICALDRYGKSRGVWRVTGARSRDWKDIAAGPGPNHTAVYLYIGDIGDNRRIREEIIVYRVVEPTVELADAGSSRTNPLHTEYSEALRLRYTDGAHNAEALMVHPQTGDIYVVTKTSAMTAKSIQGQGSIRLFNR